MEMEGDAVLRKKQLGKMLEPGMGEAGLEQENPFALAGKMLSKQEPEEIGVALQERLDENGAQTGAAAGTESLAESILGATEEEEEAYADFDLPEGINIDTNILALATSKFKALGLTQEQAQGVVDLSPQITETIIQVQQKEWDNTTTRWARELREDPTLGGVNFKQTVSRAERALNRFDQGGKLKEFLVSTKAGNNPELIRFLVKVDGALSESSLRSPAVPVRRRELSDAEIFFPEQARQDALTRRRLQQG